MAKDDWEEQVDYISFWTWEYCRRRTFVNSRELSDFMLLYWDIEECFHYEDGWCYDICANHDRPVRGLCAITWYMSSDEIVDAISEDRFEYIYREADGAVRTGFSCIKERPGFDINRIKKSLLGYARLQTQPTSAAEEQGANIEMVAIDFSKPLSDLVACLEYEYIKRSKKVPEAKAEKITAKYTKLLHRLRTRLKRVKIVNHARGVGLWLWDRVNVDGMGVHEAIECLKEEYYIKDFGFHDVDMVVLRRLYRHTADCIKKGKVLPIEN